MSQRPNRSPVGTPIRIILAEGMWSQREAMATLLSSSSEFLIVGIASTGREAVQATLRLRPDVLVMDIALPMPNGYETALEIMQQCPTPIVLVGSESITTAQHDEGKLNGAVAVVARPRIGVSEAYPAETTTFLTTLRLMAGVRVVKRSGPRAQTSPTLFVPSVSQPRVLAIAASTGGPAAVQLVLKGLGHQFPLPVLVAQHIAQGFVLGFVEWLNATVPLQVKLANHLEPLLPGHVYLAPDQQHLLVHASGFVGLRPVADGEMYCPSGDVLFNSVATVFGVHAIGVILTGMGADGSRGLLALREAGGFTLGQDEATSVVFGMPKAAVDAGAVVQVEPIAGMAPAILRQIQRDHGRGSTS